MRGWLRKLGGWERVGGSDAGQEPPDAVVREIENAAAAYENVHDEKPRRQVFEVEYGDRLYRARFRRDGDGVTRTFYRAPNASSPVRTARGIVTVVGEAAATARRVREDPAALTTRKTVFSAFAFVLAAALVAGVAGVGGVGPSVDGTNAADADAANGTGNVTDADVLNGSFVFNEVEAERLIVQEANEVRRRRGSGTVRADDALSTAATAHAGNMAENEYVGHVTPTGDGVGDRYAGSCDPKTSDGYSEQRYSENAAAVAFEEGLDNWNGTVLRTEEDVAEFVVDAWMGSSDHRENLLDARHNATGVGVRLSDGKVFAVQAFC